MLFTVHDTAADVAPTDTAVQVPQLSTSLDSVMRPASPLDALSAHRRVYHVPAESVAFIDAALVPDGARLLIVTEPKSVAFDPELSVARWKSAENEPPVAAGPLLVTEPVKVVEVPGLAVVGVMPPAVRFIVPPAHACPVPVTPYPGPLNESQPMTPESSDGPPPHAYPLHWQPDAATAM